MKRSFCLLGVLCFFITVISVNAQERRQLSSSEVEVTPGFRRQALVLDIEARVLEGEQTVVWNEVNRKVSIPGVPVGIQLEGSNIVVVVQFTPYVRRDGNVLVAQGQIWIADQEKGVTYYTSIQTIPMELGEPIYFYPLGSSKYLNPSIEIIVTVNPYNETGVRPESSVNTRNGG